jgi:dihydroorotate dehydrogenase
MYRYFIRKLLFFLKPETVHNLIVMILKTVMKIPGFTYILSKFYVIKDSRLTTNFLGLEFENPVGLAAGFDKNAEVYNEFKNFGFSFIEIGTVTPKPQPGNPKPRSFRIPKDKGLINRMGFNNKGVDYAVERLQTTKPRLILGGNIGKNTDTPNDQSVSDYTEVLKKLYTHVDYLVINLSCPNIKNLNELQDKDKTIEIIHALENERKYFEKQKPVLLKISPDLTTEQLDDAIDIYYQTGIDGIIATNTTVSRKNLATSDEKISSIGSGGLSGKPLTKRSTEFIRYISEKSNGEIPIIGVGGIMTVEDALEKLKAGATLIQIYTGFIYNGPAFVKQINKAILRDKTTGKFEDKKTIS